MFAGCLKEYRTQSETHPKTALPTFYASLIDKICHIFFFLNVSKIIFI